MLLFNELHRSNKTTEDTLPVHPHSTAFQKGKVLSQTVTINH